MPPMISVIIPVYNRREELARCLSALVVQCSDTPNVEIIVVDNNSNEDIRSIINNFDFPIRLLHQPLLGAAAARNCGAAHASSSSFVFMDSDTIIGENWLNAAMAQLAKLRHSNEESRLFAGGKIEIAPSTNKFVSLFDSSSLNQEQLITKSQFAASAHLWISRELFEKAGGFDEEKAVCEDYFFCDAVRRHGVRLHYWPEVAVHHPAQQSIIEYVRRLKRNCFAEIITRKAKGQSPLILFARSTIAHLIIEPIAIVRGPPSLPLLNRLAAITVRVIRPAFILQGLINPRALEDKDMKLLMR
jgi:GT2 family glycosyltransferase